MMVVGGLPQIVHKENEMPIYNPTLTITSEQDAAATSLAATAGMTKAQWLQSNLNRALDSKIENDLNVWYANLSVDDKKLAKSAFEAL